MSTTGWGATLALPVSKNRDHIRGPANAAVSLVEYGDYECPFCGAAHQIVKAIIERMDGGVQYVFRHFPLTTIHPNAEQAAEAAEAAGAQHKFWPMHDMLYEHQQALAPQHLLFYAEALGLDLGRFGQDLATHVHAPKVREDFMSGVRSGVNGTPTFFINGVRHDGSWDFETLFTALQRAAGQSAA
jgi:protein-disulfide isomerase